MEATFEGSDKAGNFQANEKTYCVREQSLCVCYKTANNKPFIILKITSLINYYLTNSVADGNRNFSPLLT